MNGAAPPPLGTAGCSPLRARTASPSSPGRGAPGGEAKGKTISSRCIPLISPARRAERRRERGLQTCRAFGPLCWGRPGNDRGRQRAANPGGSRRGGGGPGVSVPAPGTGWSPAALGSTAEPRGAPRSRPLPRAVPARPRAKSPRCPRVPGRPGAPGGSSPRGRAGQSRAEQDKAKQDKARQRGAERSRAGTRRRVPAGGAAPARCPVPGERGGQEGVTALPADSQLVAP